MVGVRSGSPVTMCRSFIPTGSTILSVSGSVAPV